MAELATVNEHLRSMATFDRLGGADSFWGRKHVFEELLCEEHEAAGEGRAKGMYGFHGMEQYGNITVLEPSEAACARFIDDFGYTMDDLRELEEWYEGRGPQGSIDAVTLAVYMQVFRAQREKQHGKG